MPLGGTVDGAASSATPPEFRLAVSYVINPETGTNLGLLVNSIAA